MSNVVNFPNIKAQRETQQTIEENTRRVRDHVIPELQESLEFYGGPAKQGIKCAIEMLNGFLGVSPHMLPLLVMEAHQNAVYFSVMPQAGITHGPSTQRYFLKINVTPCDTDVPETFSMAQPDVLVNKVHAEYNWHLGKPLIQPIGYLWSYLMVNDWWFAHHEVEPNAKTITQYWRNDDYQITTVVNHDNLEATIQEWDNANS